jgi:endogenous inhibitor of DNA gyrase (YacG/DUF329 family)
MKYYRFGTFDNGNNGMPNGSGDRWANVRFWLTTLFIFWAIGAIGLGWIVKSLFILIGLAIALPIAAFIGLQWWATSKILTAECPICSHTFTATKGSQFNCPSCGEPLEAHKDQFKRITPPGTIDIDVQVMD